MNPAWVAAIAALAGVLLGVLGWLVRQLWRAFRTIEEFREDWKGVPADDNHVARPGVLQRMKALEAIVKDVQSQVHLNSGHTLRDVVTRTEAAVAVNTEQLAAVKRVVDELKARP